MNLPDDAIEELWTLYDKSGIRPEYVLPMLYLESGFNPAAVNPSSGALGLAQDLPVYLQRNGVDVANYKTLTAAEQLTQAVVPRLSGLAAHYGTPRSATRVYQMNFLPATLATALSLGSPLAWRGSDTYAKNAFDKSGKGAIVVGDLANAMALELAMPEVKAAIARAYVLRTNAGSADPRPATGADFTTSTWLPLTVLAVVALAGVVRR